MDGEVTCRVCNALLLLGENWTPGIAKARQRICRSCNSQKGREHYKKHADRAYMLQRARLQQPEEAEKQRAYKSEYYAKNRDKWAAYRIVSNDKKKGSPWHRAGALLTWLRVRAAKKGLECNLTREWIEQRIGAGVCEATGIKFDYVGGNRRFNPWSPSVDRIDSSKGYTTDNCRVVVWSYNVAKSEWTDEVVYALAKAIVSTREDVST